MKILQLLVAKGAEMHVTTRSGYNAIHLAVMYGNLAFVKYLVEQGVDYRKIDRTAKTPMVCMIG